MPKRCKCGLGETGAHAMNCPQYRIEMGWPERDALARLDKRFKWVDVGYREYLEVTTGRLQYHWTGPQDDDSRGFTHFLASACRPVGSRAMPWAAEIRPEKEWIFVGEFHTAREAKAAAIAAIHAALDKAGGK